jgi:hypothetical protein
MMDVNVEKLRNKKLFKVHADITVYGQFTSRVIPLSISVIANDEQEAKNIARHVKITNVSINKVKQEIDFTKHIYDEDNNSKE